jgi:diguanylate cyclase
LAEAGFRLHLDDCGTGQSSLHPVQKLPFGSLKLDQSFFNLLLKEVETIPRLMLSLAKNSNMRVIGETVATRKQVTLLQSMGYSLMQGYAFPKFILKAKLLQCLQDAALAATSVSKMSECVWIPK